MFMHRWIRGVRTIRPPKHAALILVASALIILATGFSSAKIPLMVNTLQGPVIGSLSLGGVRSFKGIPYAAPPVGDLRWKAPQEPRARDLPLLCDAFKSGCPSYPSATDLDLAFETFSEDCLYLNVWTNAESVDSKLPVMVFIHGGSFLTGSTSKRYYDGTYLASKGVVVVTVNYRLGVFGFFCHPGLADPRTGGSYGNYGLLDQLEALKWIKRNIGGFGGDPDNVTLFGESAGAVSVLTLMTSDLSDGMFDRAIAQSGAIPFNLMPKEDACSFWKGMARKVGVEDFTGSLDTLMSMEWTDLLNMNPYSEAAMPAKTTRNLLCVDGYLLTEQPLDRFLKGEEAPVPLIVGCNSDELGIAAPGGPADTEQYRQWLSRSFPGFEDRIMDEYPANGASPGRAYMTAISDAVFIYTARWTADLHSKAGNQVYHYMFGYATKLLKSTGYGAFHALDIFYVFGTVDTPGFPKEDRTMARTMTEYWTSFAAKGHPVCEPGPAWPLYRHDDPQSLVLGEEVRIESRLNEDRYRFWGSILEKARFFINI